METIRSGTNARWWALVAIALAIMAATLDVTVLTIGLPTLAGALAASETQLQWFVTAYTLALAAGMLPAGLLGDRYGRRRVILIALAVFGLGSAACAFAPNPEAFILVRVVLGLAAAALIVMALSIITVLFDGAERSRAIGVWGAANFIALPLGPILGGWILTNAWWGWIFLINLPVSVIAFLAVVALVPESRAATRPRVDWLGVILSSAGLTSVMYGIVQAGDDGWSSGSALIPVLAGLAGLLAFVAWERRLMAGSGVPPLVDLDLFRSRSFTWGIVLTAFGTVGLFGAFFVLPQYTQAVMGLDPQGSGVRLLPLIVGLVVGALVADRVAARIGAKVTVAIGYGIIVGGLVVGTGTTALSGDAFLAAWTLVVGLGAGLGFATSASAAMVEIPEERAGIGSAVLQTVVKLGPAFGASILGSLLNSTYQSQLRLDGVPAEVAAVVERSVFGGIAIAQQLGSTALLTSVRDAFVAGMNDAVRGAAVAVGVAVVLAIVFLPARGIAASGAPRTPTVDTAPEAEGARA